MWDSWLIWLVDWYSEGAEARREFRGACRDLRQQVCESLGVYRLLDWLTQRGR